MNFLHILFVDPTKMANLQRFTDILESLFDQVISEGKTLMYISACSSKPTIINFS